MALVDIHELLDGKWEDGTRPKDLFSLFISKDPSDYAPVIIEGLKSGSRRVQSGCAELASLLSESEPRRLYPYLELFRKNLDAEEPVVRWEAVCTLGNLVALDKDGKIRSDVGKIASFLNDKSIVLQGHAVRTLSKIAQVYPEMAGSILDRLISSRNRFPGNRIGFVVEAMAAFTHDKKLVPKARKFVEPYADSDIKVVATKARKVLRQL